MSRYKPRIGTRLAILIIVVILIYFSSSLISSTQSNGGRGKTIQQKVIGGYGLDSSDDDKDSSWRFTRPYGGHEGDNGATSQTKKLPSYTNKTGPSKEIQGITRFEPFLGSDRGSNDLEMLNQVQSMMKHAWDGYIQYANGTDELEPISKQGHNWYNKYSLLSTPVDSLDTLFIMGLEDDYQLAKSMVLNMTFDLPITINLFETIIRVVGGLLSAYDLDGDIRLVDKAVELVDRLLPSFNGPLGIPLNQVSLRNAVAADASSGCIAEIGTLQLEFQYLSDVTGNPIYARVALRIYEEMHKGIQNAPAPGLYAISFGVMGGHLRFPGDRYGLGAASDSFYEYLLKLWISTGEDKYRVWYDESAESFSSLFVREENGQTWIPNTYYTQNHKNSEDDMEHLACFSGGMFALGALTHRRGNWTRQLDVGQKITRTCYGAYNVTESGLGSEKFNGSSLKASITWYILRPETIESIFYMWRFTHDPMYREYGRNIVKALETFCRNEAGYSGLRDVNNLTQDNLQQSFFLAETLKYLYLLFTSDDIIALEDYVFNTECHPISIRGRGRRKDASKWSPIPFQSSEYGGLEPRALRSSSRDGRLRDESGQNIRGDVGTKLKKKVLHKNFNA
ncbi:hypothetical protein SeMB42_g07241 [Synchytrium endobioticum]|uniref:alpha-1,2-Mannosidase n=1 Tax=Synchytrium endobioticum TaxID=286115 RepID=A0A507C5N5_9FUNG|nr:hypothetical protein SeMB42_g07241 [Synchytrium endobioticum]TPX39525.1 hypothetical protein SeLEV6574_g07148 [Synchytrium endobioticum]